MKVKLGCDGCIRRKTMFCPTSIECMALDNLPYYLDKISALEEIERLNNIINELEKYIGQEWYCFDNESIEFKVSKDILNKLKELKEENK